MARRFTSLVVCLLLCASAALAQGGLKNRITQQIDGSQLTRLRGNVHPLIRTGTDLGRMSAATKLRGVSLLFGPSAAQKAELDALIAQQHDPNSPLYHKWITPDEYANRFSLSPADVAKISDWLKAQGFQLDSVSRSRDRISFSGTVAQVESVFRAEFHNYLVNGEKHFSNAAELSVPAALSNSVIAISNLNDFRWRPRSVTSRTVPLKPQFTIGSQTFLLPDDLATIYNVTPLYNAGIEGSGHTIAVVGQTLINSSDIAQYRSIANLPTNPPQLVLVPNSGTPVTIQGDEREADLDVELAGGVARKATIIYIYTGNSPNSRGVIDSLEYAIDNNIAPVVSMSYGACETANPPAFFQELQLRATAAASHGQTIVSAIGDSGATDCDDPGSHIATGGLAVDLPGALQEVTSVGGTEFTGDDNVNPTYWNAGNGLGNGSAKSYIPEKVWNDSVSRGDLSATGGGVSTLVSKPPYQTALTPADGHRDVPDIALSASPDHDGYAICFHGSCPAQVLIIGGTSAGAPAFAGMLTLLNQATENAAGQGANVNPTLYGLAGSPATYAAAFHDVTTGNNKETCQGGTTGCTSSNSHAVTAETRRPFAGYAALLLLPLFAVTMSVKRRRWVGALGMLVLASSLSVQVACGGGGSTPPPPPPPNLSIGWSAGPGYDLTTGLGSVNLDALANAWLGAPFGSPAFDVAANPTAINMTTNAPGTSLITLTRDSGTFAGPVNLTCVATGDNSGDPQATCTLNPTSRTLNSGAQTGTSTLTVNATHAGTYVVSVTGQSGAVSHSAAISVTVN